MNRLITGVFFIASCLLLAACLRNDSDSNSTPAGKPAGEKSSMVNLTATPEEIDPDILASRSFEEAPMLAAKVARGELPPVADRLPENPLVIRPLESIGVYGGKLRRALVGDISERAAISTTLNDNIMRFEQPVANSIQPNLAESYEFLDGGRTAVFHLRRGLKWSDGVPYSVDDFIFWYYDKEFDDNARSDALPPREWMVDGKPIKLEKIDGLTLKVSSSEQLGWALFALSHDRPGIPKHVYAKYHPKYNPEASYEDFRERTSFSNLPMNPGMPRMSAWHPVQWDRGQKLVYERNPYYWKVDTAGNQLPYLDRLEFSIVPESQSILLKFINGELDLLAHNARGSMVPTLRANAGKAIFKLHVSGPKPGPGIYLNWDSKNRNLRQAVHDRRVRRALSHAINREEINQIVFHGLLDPSGYSYLPGNPYFSETAYKMHIDFDPGLARSLLDEAGYHDSNGDGYREFEDGVRFEITVDVTNESGFSDVCELVAEYWADIGIKMHIFIAQRDIVFNRREQGNFEANMDEMQGTGVPLDAPHHWSAWAPGTPFWFKSAAENGPDWLKNSVNHVRRAMTTIDPDVHREAMVKLRDVFAEEIPVIGIGSLNVVWGSNTRLGNVPEDLSIIGSYRAWGHSLFHEQIFIRP